ncbi:hypothetical protein [Lactococcus lactis]
MSEAQQQAFHVMTRQVPQNLRDLFRMFRAVMRYAEQRQRRQVSSQLDNEKFKALREKLGLKTSPELEIQFLRENDIQRRAIIESLSRQLDVKLQSYGEKDMNFMMRDGKMLAEAQLLKKSVNLEQVKQVLSEYKMQFHIKALKNGDKELHFFAKDANVCAKALEKAMEEISKNPEKATQSSFESEVKAAKQKEAEEIKVKQAEKQKVQEVSQTVDGLSKSPIDSKAVTEAVTIENPFEGGLDIGE